VLPEEYKYAIEGFGKGIMFGGGTEGFVDPVPRMPNIVAMLRFTPSASRLEKMTPLPEDF